MRRLAQHRFLSISILFWAIFIAFMTCVSSASARQGIFFFSYQILAVLLPGIALVYALKLPVFRDMEIVVWGYGMGLALSVVQYFLLAMTGHFEWALGLQCVISLAAVIYLLSIRRKGMSLSAEEIAGKEILAIFGFVTLNLAVSFFTYYGNNLLPEPDCSVVFPNQDLLFYIGNAVSAGKGFPVQEFRFAGEEFRYHYFGSLILEMASITTRIPELTLEFTFSWAQMPFLLIAGFWCLMRRMEIPVKYCALGEFLLLFTAGWELVVYIAFQEKMYVSPFGYDVGLAFAVLTITLIVVQNNLGQMHFGVWAAALLSFALCTGAKAPVAMVTLVAMGGVCALWLFKKKRNVEAFVYGVSLMTVFTFLFFTVISDGMSTVSHNQTGLYFSLTGHLYECGLGSIYYDMTSRGLPGILGKLLILLAYFLGANPMIYGLFYPAVLCKIKKNGLSGIFTLEGFLAVTVAVGMLLTLFTKQSGNSQMYFAMTAVPFAVLYDMNWIAHRKKGKKGAEACFIGAAAVMLLVSAGCWFQIVWEAVEEGYHSLVYGDDFEDINNSITWEEYEAYLWIKEHTRKDALLLCDTAINDELYQNFIVGVCTERQLWMEGWRYVAGYLDYEEIQERRDQIRQAYLEGKYEEIAETAGVDYLIWNRRFNPEADLSGLENCKVFDNGGVAVYEILR